MNGEHMAAEVAEQPAVFDRVLQVGKPELERIAGAIRRRRPRFVLLAARGTSDHAALYAKYLIETRLGVPAGLVSPSSSTIYRATIDMRDTLFLAVSQSGSSPDLLEPLTQARAAGAVTVAVTNSSDSPLAAAAEFCVDILAGPERALAATKTYTAQLLSLYLLIEAIGERDAEDASSLPERADRVLALGEVVREIAVRYRFADQVVVSSRGYNYATAREAALKLMETSYLVAHGFSGADLLHGPMAMIHRGFPVVAIVPDGPGGEVLRPALRRLREQRADVWVIGAGKAIPGATVALEVPDLGPEILSPLLLILPLQQFALELARLRGLDPDQPTGLEKITKTW